MGMGSGSGGVPLGAGKGVPTVPMGNGSSSPNVAAPSPAQSQTRSQYSQPFQQQYMPPPQQQFYMPPPQQRQQQMSPYNLSGAMNTTNLGQQQTNMPRQDVYYTQQRQPNYSNPTSIAQLQATYGTRPSGGEVRSAPVYQPPQQYFRPQQYQQDPYMNYVRNQQQAMQQQAVQQRGIQQLQQTNILRQQQVAQAAAQSPAAVAQRAAAQTGWNPISDIQF